MNYAKEYGALHANPKRFPGYTLKRYAGDVAELVMETGGRLLDYGSGKGFQYLKLRVHEQWGGILPYCYDVGLPHLAERPEGVFDGVICTDVLEHIEEADVPAILDDILGFADPSGSFVFLTASCRPAKRKKLSDGRNVHVTVKPPDWWEAQISLAMLRHPGRIVRACFELDEKGSEIVRKAITP